MQSALMGCTLNHKRVLSGSFAQPLKKMCLREADPTDADVLSNDLLLHILEFFVSDTGLVDGESLRSAALVCWRWKHVAYSRSIWAIPARLRGSGMSIHDSVASSLAIREADSRSKTQVKSLTGFVKLEHTFSMDSSVSNSYRVLVRATGRTCILSLAKDQRKTPEMLKELFQAHQILKGGFMQPKDSNDSRLLCKLNCFPRGVDVWNGRLVRWYDETQSEIQGSVQPILLTPLRGVPEANPSSLFSCIRPSDIPSGQSIGDMLALERSAGLMDSARTHIRVDCWATLVDWVVEIVECFDLDDHTAYRAMSFFDRFVSTSEVRIVSANILFSYFLTYAMPIVLKPTATNQDGSLSASSWSLSVYCFEM